MSLVFDSSAIAASGTLVTVCTIDANDRGPCRLTIKNAGSNALTACQVKIGPDTSHLAMLDSSTFASLAAGSIAQLLIDRPVGQVRVLATCASGTTLDVALNNTLRF